MKPGIEEFGSFFKKIRQPRLFRFGEKYKARSLRARTKRVLFNQPRKQYASSLSPADVSKMDRPARIRTYSRLGRKLNRSFRVNFV